LKKSVIQVHDTLDVLAANDTESGVQTRQSSFAIATLYLPAAQAEHALATTGME